MKNEITMKNKEQKSAEWTISQELIDEDQTGGFHIRARLANSVVMEYQVRNLFVCDDGEIESPFRFEMKAYNGVIKGTIDIEKGNTYLLGSIKWDGCSHNTFTDNYIHACSRQEMTRLGRLFERLYDIAMELIPGNGDYLL